MFYFVFKAVSSPKYVIYNATFLNIDTKTRSEKGLILSRRFIYYSNKSAIEQIILSGDIETRKNSPSDLAVTSHLQLLRKNRTFQNGKKLLCSYCKKSSRADHQKYQKIPQVLYPRVN